VLKIFSLIRDMLVNLLQHGDCFAATLGSFPASSNTTLCSILFYVEQHDAVLGVVSLALFDTT